MLVLTLNFVLVDETGLETAVQYISSIFFKKKDDHILLQLISELLSLFWWYRNISQL